MELNALELDVLPLSEGELNAGYEQFFRYKLTPFGNALILHILDQHKLQLGEILQRFVDK